MTAKVKPLDTDLLALHSAFGLLVVIKEKTMNDPLQSWEARIVLGGLRLLTILTFLAFLGFAVWHLVKLFL